MHNFLFLPITLFASLIFGCAATTPEDLIAEARSFASEPSGLTKAASLFGDFLKNYPDHLLAPAALKEFAAVSQQRGEFLKALSLYRRLIEQFSESEYCDEAQFMMAFIYEEYLKDYTKAREAYGRLVEYYPDSDLAESARLLLQHVGRNPEDWVDFQPDKIKLRN